MESVRNLVRNQWDAWLDRRIPAKNRVLLTQKRIFILPTWMGMGYLLTTFLLFIAGVNYDNSMILNFSFFLGSLFVVSILQTFSNLSGMIISAGHTEPAFAGSEAKFVLHLEKSRKKDHHSIYCSWHGFQSKAYNLTSDHQVAVTSLLPARKRGWYRPGRFKLYSVYPFGLCRAWTWVDLDMAALVYPQPIECDLNMSSVSDREEEGSLATEGHDDFAGLRTFNASDSLKTVDWKAYARRNVLYTKQFQGYQAKSSWLKWSEMHATDTELRLSGLCYWVLQFSRTNEPYGLELPGVSIHPGVGKQHEEACLTALAEFNYG